MEIIINDQRKVFAIQKEFNEMFPFLKLEFYSKSNEGGGSPSTKIMEHSGKTITECRTIHSSGHITIQPQMTVTELEQNFRDVYGLSIQVSRKLGDNWLQTVKAEGWTLEKQNTAGKEHKQSN